MKKTFIFSLFLVLILITNISLASYSTVMMEVIEEPVCTIELGENSKFEKKLIEKNLKKALKNNILKSIAAQKYGGHCEKLRAQV